MITRARTVSALLLALFCACACGKTSRPGAEARIVGTVIDASTGTPVAGVRVEGPHGTSAVSGDDGRFEIRGLREGDRGEVVAQSDDGRRGGVSLLPLAAGRREVVVHLVRP